MKKLFILLFLILTFKANAVVLYGSEWVVPQNYGCDNGSQFVQVGFSTSSEINNDRFQIMRSTDPGFSSVIYVGGPIDGCGTCGGRLYNAYDYGPFTPGAIYYYRVEALSNSMVSTYHTLGTFTTNIPTVVNWINQVTTTFESLATPNTENSYSWGIESRIGQGANIDLLHTEISKIYVEQNNHKINFAINSALPFVNLEVNVDNAGYFNLYNGTPITSYEWNNSATYLSGIGLHQLFVNYTQGSSGTIFHREYLVYVVAKSDGLYKDNYCNTMRVWKNPSGVQGIPLLLCEGFDAYNTKPEQYYREAGKDLINCLLTKGFDIYVINFKYNSQDIRNNAAIFSSAIRYVSSINSNQPIIAAGISMGGIINRYACAKAESSGVPLPISKLLTLDSPHQGAVISSTLQDWRKTKTVGDAYAENASNNDAAKELLNYNAYDPSGLVHTTFYNDLTSLNGDGYPHLVPKIGVSFSNLYPNPNSGEWLYVNINGVPGNYDQHISLTSAEQVAGSYLPDINIDPMPVSDSKFWSSSLLTFLRPFSDPTVSITQYKNPTFIPHNSSLDIIGGISKFDIVIQPTTTSFHDIIPSDIIEPIINSLITNDLYLQNKTITGIKNYIAGNKIDAGNSVTTTIPSGDFILASTSNVSMTARNQIYFASGFVVKAGSNFIAKIGLVQCDGTEASQFRNSEAYFEDNTYSESTQVLEMEDQKPENNEIEQPTGISIYPNPANAYFIIDSKVLPQNISIFNSFGIQIIENNSIESLVTKIDISSQPKGIYFVRITGHNGEIFTQKIIKQ